MEIIKEKAEPIADEIIQHIGNHLRYKIDCWPKKADLLDIKRIIKSIIIRHLGRMEQEKNHNQES